MVPSIHSLREAIALDFVASFPVDPDWAPQSWTISNEWADSEEKLVRARPNETRFTRRAT